MFSLFIYLSFYSPSGLIFCLLVHSYEIILFSIFEIYLLHSKQLRLIPVCCPKEKSALYYAQTKKHKALVSLLSKFFAHFALSLLHLYILHVLQAVKLAAITV